MYKYLALERGRPGFPQSSVLHGTWDTNRGNFALTYTAITFFGGLFHTLLLAKLLSSMVPQPQNLAILV